MTPFMILRHRQARSLHNIIRKRHFRTDPQIQSNSAGPLSTTRIYRGIRPLPRAFPVVSGFRCLSSKPYTLPNYDSSRPLRFENGKSIANLTESCILGTAGETVVLSTVATDASSTNGSSSLFTVDFVQRYAGVGQIPTHSATRRDGLRPSNLEILAGRAMDRALRPLIADGESPQQRIHVNTSVQSHTLDGKVDRQDNLMALGINSASLALSQAGLLREPVGCVFLAIAQDGTILLNPPTPISNTNVMMELLYAGTATKTIMMEFCSKTQESAEKDKIEVSEQDLVRAMKAAQDAIQPIIQLQKTYLDENTPEEETKDMEPNDEELLQSLGLTQIPVETKDENEDESLFSDAELEQAVELCRNHLKDAPLRLFGYQDGSEKRDDTDQEVSIHPLGVPLLSKSTRGRCEHLVYQHVEQLLKDKADPQSEDDESKVTQLARATHKELLKEALFTSASQYKTRGDGRGMSGGDGTRKVRPLQVKVPALPDVVHGSAFFGRGETHVLCTVTLGAPKDGLPITNPYAMTPPVKEDAADKVKGPYDDLPVGSLRYLRSQTALVSDLNSKKVKADRELTGESGTLDELQRAFLHYDFASYSTGEVPGFGSMANRRAIGHGALAEKAILPTLPPPHEFPYAIRLVCEVTGSNGSSSMASVCGATLALLDAGIHIESPVVGVSVGLAMKNTQGEGSEHDEESQPYALLLDITGTEDYYGEMDFKIAGTADGVTALQLDVKQPVPMEILVEALELAKQGRQAILQEMEVLTSESSSNAAIARLTPRDSLKESAPRVEVVRFDPLRKRDLIGPGGAVLRQLEDRFDVSLDLSQEGQCLLYGPDRQTVASARSAVMDLVADIEVGEVYVGTVIEIKDFGAVVELLRNKEGLLHVSELADDLESTSKRKGNFAVVRDHLKVGQKIEVLCTMVDPVQGSIRLSRKQLAKKKGYEPKQ